MEQVQEREVTNKENTVKENDNELANDVLRKNK